MNGPAHRLTRPPSVGPLQEPPAILEPRLRGMPEPPVAEIERWERVELEIRPLRAAAELTATARAAAFANDRVRQLLRGGRFAVLGASQLTDWKEVDQPVTVMLAYDYETQRAIRVRLTGEGESQRVEAVEETSDQPSPSDDEIEEAITLARYAEGVAPHLTSDDKRPTPC
jgi:hypothetical protein